MSVCPTCGGAVVLCARCSAPVGGKFCSACGAPVEAPPARAALPPDVHPPGPGLDAPPPPPATLVGAGSGGLAFAPTAPPTSAPPPLARPAGETGIAYAHTAVVAVGTPILVEEGDTFCGVKEGRVAVVLEAGRHPLVQEVAVAFFVRRRTNGIKLGGPIGALRDARGATGQVKVFGELGLEIGDPAAFVLSASTPADSDAVMAWVSNAALQALGSAFQEAASRGDFALTGLTAVLPGVLGRAAELFAAAAGIPGLRIQLASVSANVTDLLEAPAPAAPPPQAPAGFAPGQPVLVQWSDGNRYPGRVVQAAGDRCLVSFSNGAQDWVPNVYLSPG